MEWKNLFKRNKAKKIVEKTTGQKESYTRPEREKSDLEKAVLEANLKKKAEKAAKRKRLEEYNKGK